MANSQDAGSGIIAGINVTPLVDIMLVLLIIFMVTAKLVAAPERALSVTLPQSAAGEAVQSVLAITLTENGQTLLNGAPAPQDTSMLDEARRLHELHPDLKAVIEADKHVYHERIIQVMDVLSRAGVVQIAFAVVPDHVPQAAPP